MVVDLTNILKIIQKKAANVDSNTSTQDLTDLLKAASRADGNLLTTIDSSGELPDIGTSIGTLVYQSDIGSFRLNNGQWDVVATMSAGSGVAGSWSPVGKLNAYASGSGGPTSINSIDKFGFANEFNATNVGTLGVGNAYGRSGHSSQLYGYASAGVGGTGNPQPGNMSFIDKYSFATEADNVSVGELVRRQYQSAGISSTNYGYVVNANKGSDPLISTDPWTTHKERFSFVSDGNSSYIGNMARRLQVNNGSSAGHNSMTNGYTSGGIEERNSPTTGGTATENFFRADFIQKFPFAADDATAEIVGNLSKARGFCKGLSNETHGYITNVNMYYYQNFSSQPFQPSMTFNDYSNTGTTVYEIEKFPFAAEVSLGVVSGITTVKRQNSAGASSTSYGWFLGGGAPSVNVIDKFAFASDGVFIDVADLTIVRSSPASHQQ
jgi:hypothetical protein